MEDILNNLNNGDTLHITSKGINYLYIKRSSDLGIIYSINNSRKTLPSLTINRAFNDNINDKEINAQWYKNFNHHEYKTRGCNLQVLKGLLNRNNNL